MGTREHALIRIGRNRLGVEEFPLTLYPDRVIKRINPRTR